MSHNSDGAKRRDAIVPAIPGQISLLPRMLSGSQAKTAYALRLNAERMVKEGGLEATAFLTLTVGQYEQDMLGNERFEQVRDAAEASRRINNLNRRFLPDLFEKAIVVTERHKSGAIHFHVLGTLRGRPDIKTGVNFEQISKRNYSSASERLRAIWQTLREKLPAYGFGRAELMPIKSSGGAIACYVSKYIEKNICNRTPDDARKKLVRYLGWDKRHLKPNEFSWGTPRAAAWRAKTAQVCRVAHVESREQARECFGERWAMKLTRLWQGLYGDAESDFLDADGKYRKPVYHWNYPEREFLRRQLDEISEHKWMRKKDAERHQFSEEVTEIKNLWPEYHRPVALAA